MLNSLDLEGRPQDTRVVVAMSGGVDSSVTAALLKAEGYDVVGVTLQLYDHGAATHRKGACCAGQDIHDARAVADRIGIPHYVLDYESRFKEAVIDRFAESYVAGETPVPCVDCNMAIKFKDLLGTARELGAKVLATGHYVASRALPGGGRALYRAREEERDQSYFLFGTTHEQLDLLRFPLGDMTKAETRELARRFGLAVADKHDSQDICFVPTGRYTDVIERLKPGAAAAGDIVDHGRQGARPPRRHHPFHRRPAARPEDRRPRAALRGGARCRDAARRGRPARGADHAAHRACATSTGSARARSIACSTAGASRCSSRCARPGRRARRGCRPPPAGYEIELVDGEDGVSPGQACVFYDSAQGQARVLGGGFIRARARRRRKSRVDLRRSSEGAMGAALDRDTIEKAYARWAPVYDLVFGRGVRAGPHGLDRGGRAHVGPAGGRILEVGVGTGISLLNYCRSNRLVGIDISAPMLRRAQERVVEHKLTNVEALAVMDAKHLALAGCLVRRGGGAICHHRGAGPGGDARRVRARAQARRRDHPGQPPRRRERLSPGVRAGLLADRAAARLEPGISLGAADATGPSATASA